MTPQQLEQLILAHRRSLELFAAQWATSPEDCVQEAFLKLFRSKQAIGNPRSWLFRVVKNLAIDQGRSETQRRKREQSAGSQRTLFTTSESPRLDSDELQHALQNLANEQREVIVAKIWGRLTFEEISEALGIATSTAHRRYSIALQKLQNHFHAKSESKSNERI